MTWEEDVGRDEPRRANSRQWAEMDWEKMGRDEERCGNMGSCGNIGRDRMSPGTYATRR